MNLMSVSFNRAEELVGRNEFSPGLTASAPAAGRCDSRAFDAGLAAVRATQLVTRDLAEYPDLAEYLDLAGFG